MADVDIRDDDEAGKPDRPGPAGSDKPARQIAVALRYSPQNPDDAPRVVASGRGKNAEQILELAFSQGVRVREDPDLAEILAAVEIDSVIPLSAFIAVAEILGYVYRANNQPIPKPASETVSGPSAGGGGSDTATAPSSRFSSVMDQSGSRFNSDKASP